MIQFDGEIVATETHYLDYPEARSVEAACLRIGPHPAPEIERLVSFSSADILLTSCFVACDLGRQRAFLNQTYSGATQFFPVRFSVAEGRLRLAAEPEYRRGRHVVLGGPLDGVWYHWLFNWCPRILLLREMRPDLFDDPDVTFVLHPKALAGPFRSVLDAFDLPHDRILAWDGSRDLHLEEATLVSFLDETRLYPDLLRSFADHLLGVFAATAGSPERVRVFASRQGLPGPKRRLANFDEILPVLHGFGIRDERLGELSASDQVTLFHDAELVVGAHGSDLANLMFCRPGTPVVVIESQFSVDHGFHRGLEAVAQVFGLEYHLFVTGAVDHAPGLTWGELQGRDYLVDAERLRGVIERVLSGPDLPAGDGDPPATVPEVSPSHPGVDASHGTDRQGSSMALWFGSALLPEGWRRDVRIGIEGGRIAAVDSDSEPAPGDERHAVAVPGIANLHSHTFQRAIAGLAERRGEGAEDSFWTWRETMYGFLDRLGPDDVEAVAAMAFAEMLETGFTRAGEFHYLHHGRDGRPYAKLSELSDRIASAAEATGMGLTLLPVFYAHGGFGGLAPTHGQRRFVCDLDGFARLVEDAGAAVARLPEGGIGIAPHSLRAVTPDELHGIVALAGAGPIHIHVAEQAREVADCLAWSGARPVAWLLGSMPIDRRWCLVHATHMDPDETARLAASGATVGFCPITEANLGDGIAPASAYARAGGSYGVGSDSNVRIDLPGELATLDYAQRLAHRTRTVMASGPGASTGRSLFEAARAGGARALGRSERGLAPGEPADIVALRPDPAGDGDVALDRWIFGSRDNPVETVWRRGRVVVAGGRHVARPAIERRYAATLARLLA